ncbi:MAG: aldo/keto reductase [Chthoniobacterales bacterium]|nr:aldo/keto reductase [Chthoniobacterales bacterium]
MQTQLLGTSGIEISRLAYGCMRISGSWDRHEVSRDAVRRGIGILETAVEAGYTFFDHADIYGDTTCETIFGEALAQHPSWRDQLIVATKCGIIFPDQPTPGLPHRYDFSYRHIIDSVESSLERLLMERIDLLMLHRPDYLADPGEVARAFTELRAAGKVREFGVSNFRPSLLSALQSALDFPLQVNQVEIHPYHLDCLTDGTLDQCLERKITPMAWSPVAGGKVASGYAPETKADDYEKQVSLLEALDLAAKAYEIGRTVIALAWLLRHPSGIVPVVGSTNPDNIRAASKATDVEMDRPAWYRILRAARGEGLA